MRTIALDYETFYKKGDYSVRDLGNWRYCHDERFDAFLLSVTDGTEKWVGHPKDFNWDAIEYSDLLLAHNASFDSAVTNRLAELGVAPSWLKDYPYWQCTANMSSCLFSVRSLAEAVLMSTGQRLSKDVRDAMNGKNWTDLVREGIAQQAKEYAMRDAVECFGLWTRHNAQWSDFEKRVSQHTLLKCARGVAVDFEKLEQYITALQVAIFNLVRSMPWVQRGAKPTSPIAIAEQCREAGIPAPPVKSDDEEGFDNWQATYGPKYPWVYSAGQWRSMNKLLTSLETIRERRRPDGTIDYSALYFGAHCVTGDHEVLTKNGWVKISEWAGGEIAQWNPDGSVAFLPASPNKFKNNEALVALDAPYAKGVFTLGHTIPSFLTRSRKFTKLQAGDAAQRSECVLPVGGRLTDSGTLNVDQIRVLVAGQADGHWQKLPHGSGLQFTFRKARKLERIRALLNACSIPFRVQEFPSCPGQFRVSVSLVDCPEWLTPDRKFFGPWLLNSTPAAREAFMQEIHLWDGYKNEVSSQYYSHDTVNVDWVCTMAHLTGRSATSRPQSIHVRQRMDARAYRKHWSIAPFSDTVYCPTTKTGFWLYRYNGTIGVTGNTGRFSGGGSGLNMQNLRKDPLYILNGSFVEPPVEKDAKKKFVSEFVECPADNTVSLDMRSLFIPRPGKKFIIADLSQIEPRVLNWMAGNQELLDTIAQGFSVYEAYSRLHKGWTGEPGTLKSAIGDAAYTKIKNEVLGLGYGMGAARYTEYANVSEEEAKQVVDGFRSSNPKIVAMWDTLDKQFRASITKNFETELPSGRSLVYRNVNRSVRHFKDPETGEMKAKFIYTALVGSRRVELYGGKLTENAVQAAARDVFVSHLLDLEEEVGDVVFDVHDEAIVEVEPEVTAESVKAVMSRTPSWLPGCPITAEAKEAKHYRK
jgi:hypothetical protein